MSEKETISKSPSGRVKRAPIGRRNVLTVNDKDPNYVYRVVNDVGDNVHRLQEQGYDFAPDSKHTVGDKRVNAITSEGSLKQVSVGNGIKAFVMRIRKDEYTEQQAEKQEYVTELENATKQQALNGTYGKLEHTRS